MPPKRVEMLRNFIVARPDDPFPRYGLALELKNAGDLTGAWSEFERLLERHRDYVAGYLHGGNTLVALGRRDDARRVYGDGIAACVRMGDRKTQGEIESALSALA